MSVPSALMAVITTVPTPLDPIRVVAVPGMNWIPVDTSVKVLNKLLWNLASAHRTLPPCMCHR